MSRRRRTSAVEPRADSPADDRLRPLWLFGLTALCVATPILPSETVLFGGSTLVLMLVWWLLLLAWTLTGVVRGRLELKLGPATWALLAFLAWHSTSALVMAWHGHPRATFNMLWQWLSLGTAFFLARQLIVTAAERRAVVAVMVALAVSFSVVGYYQYFRELPATRALYQKDPEKVLREAGVDAPPGTPQRKLFEDRLNSTEPIATFALTNSLAGFLSPWLIVVLGILLTNWNMTGDARWTRIAGIVAAVLILGCWMLTKSRTAWLATLGGIVLLVVYGRRAGWRPDWRIVAGVGAAAVVLPFLGVVVGGLDWLVVLESSKSFLYRVQYWRSTAQMIGDFPWFGCGPGNFQQYYTAYKLPEASETIAEPHNFLLEVWATAGTPALALLLGIFIGVVWQVWRAEGKSTSDLSQGAGDESRLNDLSEHGSVRAVYWGALMGGLVGYVLCGFMEGYFPSPGLVVLGFPAAAGVLVRIHRWVCEGRLLCAVLATAIVVMLVNFLAAGGIGFAGVALSLWLLAALLLNQAEADRQSPPEVWNRTLRRWPAIGITVAVGVLFVCFHQTAYSPITEAQTLLTDGNTRRMLGQPLPALTAFRRAADADPFSPEPWERAGELANEIWVQSGEHSFEELFRVAVRENLARNSRSSNAHMLVGHQWLAAYRRFGKRDYLDQAVGYYGIAVKLYPNYNLGRAQLAWALHLAGEDKRAKVEADEALRLDSLNPHQEQKLARQRLFDATPSDATQPAPPGDRSAEQMLRELRNR